MMHTVQFILSQILTLVRVSAMLFIKRIKMISQFRLNSEMNSSKISSYHFIILLWANLSTKSPFKTTQLTDFPDQVLTIAKAEFCNLKIRQAKLKAMTKNKKNMKNR